MADVKISGLTPAAAALGAMELEVNDAGSSKKITVNQVQDVAIGTTNGLIARTGANATAARAIQAGNGIVVSDGDGVAGNPTVAADYASQAEAEAGTDTTKLMTPERTAQAIVALGGGEVESYNSNRTLSAGDDKVLLVLNASTSRSLELPANASVALPVGFETTVLMRASDPADVLRVRGETGVGVVTQDSLIVLDGGVAICTKIETDTWHVRNTSKYPNSPLPVLTSNLLGDAAEVGDLWMLFAETAAQAVSPPAGFSVIPGLPQTTGSAGGVSSTALYGFYRIVDGTETSSVTLPNPGDHLYQTGLVVRNVDPVNPFGATAGSIASTATTSVSMPSVTTTRNDNLVVSVLAHGVDTTVPQFSGESNGALSKLTLMRNISFSSGNGGGYAIVTGVKSSPGATGATTGTLATASVQARWTGAFNPK